MRLHPRDLRTHTLILLDHDGLEIARVVGDAWLPFASSIARGYDREDAAQRGAPDPWSPEFSDLEWEAMRRNRAIVALRVAFASVIQGPRPCGNPVAEKGDAASEPRGSHQITRFTTTDGNDPMHNPILRHFAYDHLPKRLQDVSRAFHALAARDCAVRAAMEGEE